MRAKVGQRVVDANEIMVLAAEKRGSVRLGHVTVGEPSFKNEELLLCHGFVPRTKLLYEERKGAVGCDPSQPVRTKWQTWC